MWLFDKEDEFFLNLHVWGSIFYWPSILWMEDIIHILVIFFSSCPGVNDIIAILLFIFYFSCLYGEVREQLRRDRQPKMYSSAHAQDFELVQLFMQPSLIVKGGTNEVKSEKHLHPSANDCHFCLLWIGFSNLSLSLRV